MEKSSPIPGVSKRHFAEEGGFIGSMRFHSGELSQNHNVDEQHQTNQSTAMKETLMSCCFAFGGCVWIGGALRL